MAIDREGTHVFVCECLLHDGRTTINSYLLCLLSVVDVSCACIRIMITTAVVESHSTIRGRGGGA